MSITQNIIYLYEDNPTLTVRKVAERVKCSTEYVRAVCQRKGIKFARSNCRPLNAKELRTKASRLIKRAEVMEKRYIPTLKKDL